MWLSVDGVEPSEEYRGWAETFARRTMDGLNDVGMVMEMEALLILAVGSHTVPAGSGGWAFRRARSGSSDAR